MCAECAVLAVPGSGVVAQVPWTPWCVRLCAGVEDLATFTATPIMHRRGKTRGEGTDFLIDALAKFLKKEEDKPCWKNLSPTVSAFVDSNK